jgi:hypothetical protein
MARLTNQVLGDPQGTIGKIVFKIKGKTNIIALRPGRRTKLPTPAMLAAMAKFGLTGKIAKAINSISQLKDVWPASSNKLSKCNEIFQTNYKLVGSAESLGTVAVAPIWGFNLENPVVTAGASNVQLASDPLGVGIGIDTSVEKRMMAVGVIVLQSPTIEGIPEKQVISFQSDAGSLDLISPISLTANLKGVELDQYESYTERNAFVCLLTINDANKAIRYSKTFHS